MEVKRAIVLGTPTNASRYSNMAVKKLLKHGIEVVSVGIKKGDIEGIELIAADGVMD